MTANVVPLKHSVSPLLVHKDQEHQHHHQSSCSSTTGQHLLSSGGSFNSDSGCFLSPVSISYDVRYDYRRDQITVIKIENFSSPEPSPISDRHSHSMDVRRIDGRAMINGSKSCDNNGNYEYISAENLLDKSQRRLKRSVTFREDTIDINEEISRLRPEHSINEENLSQVSCEGQQSVIVGEVINLTPISLTVIILLSLMSTLFTLFILKCLYFGSFGS